eukprot:6183905-Pleurochrysis_carterae.AAC.2
MPNMRTCALALGAENKWLDQHDRKGTSLCSTYKLIKRHNVWMLSKKSVITVCGGRLKDD